MALKMLTVNQIFKKDHLRDLLLKNWVLKTIFSAVPLNRIQKYEIMRPVGKNSLKAS